MARAVNCSTPKKVAFADGRYIVELFGEVTKRRMGKWIHVVVEGGGVGSQYAIGGPYMQVG